jgi:predicted permease
MLFVINTLAPIIVLISLGYGLRKGGFTTTDQFRHMNRFVYWVALPVLLFYKTAQAQIDIGAAFNVFLVMFAGMAASMVVAYPLAGLMKMKGRERGVFVQGAYRGNLAYIGLPLILFALESSGAGAAMEAVAVIAIVPLIIIYNVVAVVVLVGASRADAAKGSPRLGELCLKVASNPLILACAAGLAVSFSGLSLPLVVARSSQLLGGVALPMALLGIGAAMRLETLHRSAFTATLASLIKTVGGPAVTLWVATMLGLDRMPTIVALLYMACPTAVASYVMADQLGGDAELAASIVVASTLISIVPLSIILAVV